MSLPKNAEPVRFAGDIQPLFREKDRQSMRRHFDLGSYEDVSEHADSILERLRSGTMPCDGAWPAAQVDLLIGGFAAASCPEPLEAPLKPDQVRKQRVVTGPSPQQALVFLHQPADPSLGPSPVAFCAQPL